MSAINPVSKESKHERIKIKWAENTQHVVTLSDDELIQAIHEYELAHIDAQVKLEAARAEGKRRADSLKGKFAAEQRELDRQYQPKPTDRVEFDIRARKEKVTLSKDEKAIQKMMSLGLSREKAIEVLSKGKEETAKISG